MAADIRSGPVPRCSSGQRSSAWAASISCSTTPAGSTWSLPRTSRPRAGERSIASTWKGRSRCARPPTSLPRATPAPAPAPGTIINVTVSPHHGMPAMAHTGAARGRGRSDHARTRVPVRSTRHRGRRGRARPIRHRVAPHVPGRAVETRGRRRSRTASRERRGARLADRVARHPARRVAVGFGRHPRRRARQLDGSVAAHGPHQGWRGADGRAPLGRLTPGSPAG